MKFIGLGLFLFGCVFFCVCGFFFLFGGGYSVHDSSVQRVLSEIITADQGVQVKEFGLYCFCS